MSHELFLGLVLRSVPLYRYATVTSTVSPLLRCLAHLRSHALKNRAASLLGSEIRHRVALRLVCASVAQAIGAWRHSTTLPLAHKEIQNAKIQHYLLFRQKPALARGVLSQ